MSQIVQTQQQHRDGRSAAHCVLLSDLHEDDQQVKASGRKLCQCHSGEDSVCLVCALHSKKESGETRKESTTA